MSGVRGTFRSKLYSIFIISIIVPIIIIGILFTVFYSRTMVNQEKQNIRYILRSICNSMEVQFTEIKNIGDSYYMQREVFQEVEALNNPKLYANYDELMKSQLETEYSITMIKKLYMSKQKLCDVVFFPINSEEGKAYYVDKNHSNLQVIDLPGYEEEEWFEEALEADGKAVFYGNHSPSYREDKDSGEVYSCVRAIMNMDNRKIIGVIKIDADLKNLQKAIDVVGTESGDNIVISDEGRVLISAAELKDPEIQISPDGVHRMNGRVYYAQTITVPDTDWELTYFFSMWTVFGNYLLVLLLTCVITAAAVLSAFLIYKRHAKETVDDMEHVTNVFRQIQIGNLDVKAEVKSGNELHDIAEAVNLMIQNLKSYIDKEYIWVIRQQKAEYQALQAQINPHFLYNTLNGFIALNRMGETKKLERSIINLTYLFRYICSNESETTVERECEFLKEYLELEKLKYEERLEYMVWVDDACRERLIPKLLLQPIVENSIVHGMGDTDEPILVTIMAREIETRGIGKVMVITVRDNGVGFDQASLDREKEHIGIDNVRIRAELFSSHTIYQCVSAPGKGTKTTFVFESEKEEEDQ